MFKEQVSNSLLLGRKCTLKPRQGIGFINQIEDNTSSMQAELIDYLGTGHLMTIGPTGSGKSCGSAIPALLRHDGPAIVVDIKGELFNTTASYRRAIGQKVYKLDPWQVTNGESDSLNPMDLLELPGADIEEEASALAKLMAGSSQNPRDRFWDNTAQAFMSGLIAYFASDPNEAERRLSRARKMFTNIDLTHELAILLDKNRLTSQLAYDEFAIFLQHPERETRPCIQSTAQQHFSLLGSEAVKRTMDHSNISLQDMIDAKPMTVYLIIPPHKLESHISVLRLWLGTMLQALSRRQHIGDKTTLFLVDEAASFGAMEPLKRAITLLRGYGVQVWTFWQDLSQIQALYPNDWRTLVNNIGVLQLLSPRNYPMAQQYADLVGNISADEILTMPMAHQLLLTEHSHYARICQCINYLQDQEFVGRFTENPMYHHQRQQFVNNPQYPDKILRSHIPR